MYSVIFEAQKGKLVFENIAKRNAFHLFSRNLPDGTRVEGFYDIIAEDHTLPQIKKIYACIKVISDTIGDTVEEVKKQVKEDAGLLTGKKKDNPDILLIRHSKASGKFEVHRSRIDGDKNFLFDTADVELAKKMVSAYNKKSNQKYKSFSDCSKVELSLAIQAIIKTGDFIGVNFR